MLATLALLALGGTPIGTVPDLDINYGVNGDPAERITIFLPDVVREPAVLFCFSHFGGFLTRDAFDFIGPGGASNDGHKLTKEVLLQALVDQGFVVMTFGGRGSNDQAHPSNPGAGAWQPIANMDGQMGVTWYDESAVIAFDVGHAAASAAIGQKILHAYVGGISAGSMVSFNPELGRDLETKMVWAANAPIGWLYLDQAQGHTGHYLPDPGGLLTWATLSEVSLAVQFAASPQRHVDAPDGILWMFENPHCPTPGDYYLTNPATFSTLSNIHDAGPALSVHWRHEDELRPTWFWLDDECFAGQRGVDVYVDVEHPKRGGPRSRAGLQVVLDWVLETAPRP